MSSYIPPREMLNIYNSSDFDYTTNNIISNLVAKGSFKYLDGNQTDGYVLTSDENGNATWQSSVSENGAEITEQIIEVHYSFDDVGPNKRSTLPNAIAYAITLNPQELARILIVVHPDVIFLSEAIVMPDYVSIVGYSDQFTTQFRLDTDLGAGTSFFTMTTTQNFLQNLIIDSSR